MCMCVPTARASSLNMRTISSNPNDPVTTVPLTLHSSCVTCKQAFVTWSLGTTICTRSSQSVSKWRCTRYAFANTVLPARRSHRSMRKCADISFQSTQYRRRHFDSCARLGEDGRNDKSGIDDDLLSDIPVPLPQGRSSLSDSSMLSSKNTDPTADLAELNGGTRETHLHNGTDTTTALARQRPTAPSHDRFKVQRRITVGFVMGAVVIAFVFSGRWLFAVGMLGISLTGLYEYYRMVAAKGHLPAYKTGLCVTAATMSFSAFAPHLADVAFPVGATFICIYLLFRQSKIATIADISTTFMGLFYAGYLPSYWIRLHEYTPYAPDNVVANTIGRLWLGGLFGFRPTITVGSLLVFWTWLSAASADIGAFFIGRTYGRTRFSHISPKKTVEGAIAGFICSASVSILGAYLLHWPLWWATGAVYGIIVGVLGLCGDLFESCFKRDVGWKDSGSLFPGHGGMLDRADSYVLVAPLVYFFATMVLPAITRVMR